MLNREFFFWCSCSYFFILAVFVQLFGKMGKLFYFTLANMLNRGVQNPLPLTKITFEIECHTSEGDHVSPAQVDGSSCGVHACINSYFFMNEGRLATTADYTPNANGVSGLKRFLLFKLMQANLMVQLAPNIYEEQGGARGLFHQYLTLNGDDAVLNRDNEELALALQQIVNVWGVDETNEKKVHDVIRLDMEDD
jgi:hypothetical protein